LQKLVFDAFVENCVPTFQRIAAVKNRTFFCNRTGAGV
jgi:hypothetical protein